jgi:hypothetical protein
VPAGEPADPAAHGQPGHPGAGDDPERDGEPVRLGGLVDVGERRPRLDADDPPPGVHPDRPERAQVEDHAPVHRPVAGHAVAAAADGQPQPMLAGQGHGGADVAGLAGPDYRPWPPVDHAVPDPPGLAVAGVPVHDQIAGDLAPHDPRHAGLIEADAHAVPPVAVSSCDRRPAAATAVWRAAGVTCQQHSAVPCRRVMAGMQVMWRSL